MKESIDKFLYENEYKSKGYKLIAGVDEVGRGPLAGPVVCACCIMSDNIVEGVDDSKKLSKTKREKLYDQIINNALSYSICEIDHEKIDEINILNATKLCMQNTINTLKIKPDVVFIDAVKLDIDVETVSIIKGDAKSYTIGCASILAKVYRDRLMEEYSKIYQAYGFEKNSGYGTKQHIDKIKEIGPCQIHRKTFIKNFWDI
ncbi:MAG: ribonuclease HII [Clostridia bacterium]|nr:ribonuclease HII [Clostridia bacterium]